MKYFRLCVLQHILKFIELRISNCFLVTKRFFLIFIMAYGSNEQNIDNSKFEVQQPGGCAVNTGKCYDSCI